MRSAPGRLLLTVIVLVSGAGAVLAVGSSEPRLEVERQQFHRAVGGLGTGPAVHPARCGRAFDVRVAPSCSWRHGAIVGGDRYCPLHGPAVG